MTKQPMVSHTLENRSCDSSVPQKKGVIFKIETSYDKPNDGEIQYFDNHCAKREKFDLSDTVNQDELMEGELTTLNGGLFVESDYESNGKGIVCIQDCTVFEDDSKPILLNFIEKNGIIPHSIKKSGEDVPVEQNGEAMNVEGSISTFSDTILKVSEEMKINKKHFAINFPPLWGLTSICGRRTEMEDSAVALPRFLSIPSYMLGDLSFAHQDFIGHLFGVYDGHGGCQVADYCRDRLHQVLAEEIGVAKENRLIEKGEVDLEEQWMKLFLNCFRKLDDEVGGFPRVNGDIDPDTPFPPIAPDSVGSTAVVAVVCSTHFIVANCGDSRAVLYRGKMPMPLSVDHKPNREDECTRIEAAGGKVINWDGYRVSGFLAVSRSIGDRYLRPYVIADPDVMFVPRAKEDECLILASDGLWDVMKNDEACDLARRRILLWHKKNGPIVSEERGEKIDPAAQDAADYLSRLAFQRGSRDNISVIVIDLKAQRKLKKKT